MSSARRQTCAQCKFSFTCLATPVDKFGVAYCEQCNRISAYVLTGESKVDYSGDQRWQYAAVYAGVFPVGWCCDKLTPVAGMVLRDMPICGNCCACEEGGAWWLAL